MIKKEYVVINMATSKDATWSNGATLLGEFNPMKWYLKVLIRVP